MRRGVRWYRVGSLILVALIALAGCSHYMWAEREPWRHDAEVACLNSGAVKETPARVRISAISGPGACGADFPLRVSALGESGPLGYTDDAPVPPGAIPNASLPQHWPVTPAGAPSSPPVSSQQLPPPPGAPAQSYPSQLYPRPSPQQPYAPPPAQPAQSAPVGQPLSINPPGLAPPEDDEALDVPGGPPHPYYGNPNTTPYAPAPMAPYAPAAPATTPPSAEQPPPPLGPARTPLVTGSVEVKPAATLACPIVSALDQWISAAVQPAAMRWFRQPVVEIKQISAYSCRGMNGNPNAHISEHAFGNALDIAEFTLADGHKISVQYGWHGSPEEQGFLRDVQAAACQDFTTVLAPGANVYHYNHIHVDLMRHYNGRHICEPAAISGEVVAERARARFAAQHGEPNITGSLPANALPAKSRHHPLSYSDEDDHLPEAVPGED